MILTRNPQTKIFDTQGQSPKLVEMDLLNISAVKNYLENFRPTIILHLAGYTYKPESHSDVFEKFNFDATAKLVEMADAVKVKKFILLGTADEYGFQICPQVETMPAMPVSEYAVSKNKAVNRALSLFETNKFPVVILRPFTIYGSRQPAKMFISQAVEAAVKKNPFEMSEGRQKRDLLFVTDFVNAIIKILTETGIEGETFNVGSGESIALEKLARKIWEIAGADDKLLNIGARRTDQSELHDTEADVSKISARLNWKPKISLEKGLELVVEQARKDLE
jgi:nucleoside-diphosphate-sugar epimerase